MKIIAEPLPGVKILQPTVFEDERGNFVKTFQEFQLEKLGMKIHIREEFFSTSARNVLRGMHFQHPPHAHQKLIYCMSGKVLDVILDLRKSSKTYGEAISLELSAENHHILFIPLGFAHGFLSLEDNSCLVYKTDAAYAPDFDMGIHWESFGFNWPNLDGMPIISPRDQGHTPLSAYYSPF